MNNLSGSVIGTLKYMSIVDSLIDMMELMWRKSVSIWMWRVLSSFWAVFVISLVVRAYGDVFPDMDAVNMLVYFSVAVSSMWTCCLNMFFKSCSIMLATVLT